MAVVKEAGALKVRPGQRRQGKVVASALPRTIVYSAPRRRVVKPGSPRAVLQQEALNMQTGKKAVGPWLGPFAAAPEAGSPTDGLIPSTIFMDARGNCHLDLDLQLDRKLSMELNKAQSDSGLLSEASDEAAAKVANLQLQLRREKQQQARAVQMHAMMTEHASLDKTPPAKNIIRRMHVINQPRRFN